MAITFALYSCHMIDTSAASNRVFQQVHSRRLLSTKLISLHILSKLVYSDSGSYHESLFKERDPDRLKLLSHGGVTSATFKREMVKSYC